MKVLRLFTIIKKLIFYLKISLKYKLKVIQTITKHITKYHWLHSF